MKKQEPPQIKKISIAKFYNSVGRRKESTCRVRVYLTASGDVKVGDKTLKSGDMVVNGRTIDAYFPGPIMHKTYMKPFELTETVGRFAVSAIASGGGLNGQCDAFALGIARILNEIDRDKFRATLKKEGLMMRDPRMKERRKAGNAQKARAKKQSPKR